MHLQVEQHGLNSETKEATVIWLDAHLVLKQKQAAGFQSAPYTYRWLIVTTYHKLVLSLPNYEVAILVN
jgi:hypothetical protein